MGTDAENGDITGFTIVGPRQVILQTLVTVKQTCTGTEGQSGSVNPTFGRHVIRTPRLQTRGTMIGIVDAGVATYVFVGLEAAGTEIARLRSDHIIVTLVVQENELFFLGWTEGTNAVPSCGLHEKELVVVERGSHGKFL